MKAIALKTALVLLGVIASHGSGASAQATSADGASLFPVAFSCFEFNADYEGAELTRFPADSATACRQRCADDDNCSFFNHYPLSSICILRSGPPYTGHRSRVNVISGPKECITCAETDTAYSGEALDSTSAYSATHCQTLCSSHNDCELFTFDVTSRTCEFKPRTAKKTDAPNKISGRKNCEPLPVDTDPAPACAVRRVRYGKSPFAVSQAEDANECQAVCADSSICEAFSFDTYEKTCNLHLAVGAKLKEENDDFISGPKECGCLASGSDFEKADTLQVIAGEITVAEECQLRCQSTVNCTAWSFSASEFTCNLLQNHSGSKKADGVISGEKYCSDACDIRGFHSPAMSTSHYTLKEGQTLDQCRAGCLADSECVVFTWWDDKRCYLKDESCLRNLEAQTGNVRTGWKACSTCFREGVGYKATDENLIWHLETQNAEECRQRCALMEDCTNFTFDAASKKCFMLSGTAEELEDESLQSGPANCTVDTSCLSKNVMWERNDNIMDTRDQQDPEACQRLCASVPKCRFFTFSLSQKRCFLKTGYLGEGIRTVQSADHTSGPKKCWKTYAGCEEKDMDYPNGDIYATADNINDTDLCREACAREPQCRAFTVNHVDSKCWKKTISGFSKRKSARNASSGAKYGCPVCPRGLLEYTGTVVQTITMPSLMTCQLSCELEAKCNYFTYKGTSCKLMQDMGQEKQASSDTVSGPKTC